MQAIADLTAAITLLTSSLSNKQIDSNPQLQQLLESSKAILPELSANTPDKSLLKERLDAVDKVRGILSKTITIGTASIPSATCQLLSIPRYEYAPRSYARKGIGSDCPLIGNRDDGPRRNARDSFFANQQ